MAGLTDLLADDVLSTPSDGEGAFGRVVLWLDPESEFGRLWPGAREALTSRGAVGMACPREGGYQLELKVRLLEAEGKSDATVVVYLPGFSPEALEPRGDGAPPVLWSIYEYRYKGSVWSHEDVTHGQLPEPPSLLAWLENNGLKVSDDATAKRLVEGGRNSLLARYAEKRRGQPPTEWPRPLRESDILQVLGGDPRDALSSLISSPNNAVRAWGEAAGLTLDGMTQHFGVTVPPGAEAPEELADAFVVQLALIDAWDAFGRPDDFPFRARLPNHEDQRERCTRFLQADILQDTELGPRYRERMLRLEHDYDLTTWSEGRSGQPRGLPRLARNRFREFMGRFDPLAKEDWKGAARFLLDERDALREGARTPWDTGEDTHWAVLADAATLRAKAQLAVEEAGGIEDMQSLVEAYTDRWWEVELLHLHVRASCAKTTGLEQVRRVVDLTYFHYAESANMRFTHLLESDGAWPSGVPAGVDSLREVLWGGDGGRKAVVIVDALRWDLARSLADLMRAKLLPVLATIPTTTPFGMTALLPLGNELPEVTFDKGVAIRQQAGGPDLATRQGRKRHLEDALKGRKPSFLDLEEVLKGVEIPDGFVVVFDNTIDETGHKGTEEFPLLAEQLVGKLRRAIEKLHEAGIEEIHVVTDHGFLLLPSDMVDGLGRPAVKADQTLRRESRWAALKPGAPVTGLIRMPLPLSKETIELGFPRGVRTLVAAEDFTHGGLSLQETVVPHIVSRSVIGPARADVEIDVVTRELTGGTIPVVVRPAFAGQGTLLGTPAPVQVALWVEGVPASGGAPLEVTERMQLEVRTDAKELRPPLYLREGAGLAAGTELTLRAIDRDTGKELASIPLTLKVDWE